MFEEHQTDGVGAHERLIHKHRHASLRGAIVLSNERQIQTQWILDDSNTLGHDALEGLCADAYGEGIFGVRLKHLRLGRD